MRLLLVLVLLTLSACGTRPPPAEVVPSWAKVAPEQIAEARKHGVPVAFENDLGMRFVLIPAGTFLMGAPVDERERRDDESLHEVTISAPFYVQTTEVTYAQLAALGQMTEVDLRHPHLPASGVTYNVAVEFGRALSMQSEGRIYRLPTEAEWEYACRAGSTSRYSWGESESRAGLYANVADRTEHAHDPQHITTYFDTDDGHAGGWPAPPASYEANAWGLYDMHGNVKEWCEGWYRPYGSTPGVNRADSVTESRRVVRGGGWLSSPARVRSARREQRKSDPASGSIGFRLVSPLPVDPK